MRRRVAKVARWLQGWQRETVPGDTDEQPRRIRLTLHFEDGGDGWIVASIPEVPGALSQGRTRKEARENLIDALATVLTPDDELAGSALASDDEPLTLTFS